MKTLRLCKVWSCVTGGGCDRRRNLRDIASEVGISFGAVQSILTYILGMPKVSAIWVPRMLTENQNRSSLYISRYLLSRYEDDLEEQQGRKCKKR